MKKLIYIIIICCVTACTKYEQMNTDFNDVLERKSSLTIYEIKYGDVKPQDSVFFTGYGIKSKKTLTKSSVTKLISLLKDSSNYSVQNSRNCVLTASYGMRVTTDSVNYIAFVGREPCMKLSILNETKRSEITIDLVEKNAIIPFLDSLFKK